MYYGSNDPFYDARRRRAAEYYKKVLRWQNHRGRGYANARQAAIGLPAALQSIRGREHVRAFVDAALADGTPLDDLILLAEELAREMGRGRSKYILESLLYFDNRM